MTSLQAERKRGRVEEKSNRKGIVAKQNDNQFLYICFVHEKQDCEQYGLRLGYQNEVESELKEWLQDP